MKLPDDYLYKLPTDYMKIQDEVNRDFIKKFLYAIGDMYRDIASAVNTNEGFYVDRGDFSGNDWTHADLTMDNAWHDLDLSSIVPAGARLVHLFLRIYDDSLNNYIMVRENGNTSAYNVGMVYTVVADKYHVNDVFVAPDSNGVIEYLVNSTATNIAIRVRGWFK